MKLLKDPATGARCLVPDEDLDLYAGWTILADSSRDAVQLEIAKEAKRTAIMQRMAVCFEAGFEAPDGPLHGHRLQVREEDKANWLTSQAAYSAAVAAGAGDLPGATFRTMANETVACTFEQGLTALLDMASWGQSVMGRSWMLKDAVRTAADMGALKAIDIEAGWP